MQLQSLKLTIRSMNKCIDVIQKWVLLRQEQQQAIYNIIINKLIVNPLFV